MRFREILKDLRKNLNLGQVELGKKIGYTGTSVSRWERGEQDPTLAALIAMANFFNVTIDYLAGRENEDFTKTFNTPNNPTAMHLFALLEKNAQAEVIGYMKGLLKKNG